MGSEDGYSRDKFPHWITQSGTCNTREVVLKRDGTNVVQSAQCEATSGTWKSPYDSKTWTDAEDIQIDHMVPLANAWRVSANSAYSVLLMLTRLQSGASRWTTDQRRDFANDLVRPQLWAVTGSVNGNKSDSSPDEWKPPLSSFHCTYAEAWVAVKGYYNLTITSAEKGALSDMLATC